MADTIALLISIGLTEQKAKETIKNQALTQDILNIITEAKKNISGGEIPQIVGTLLYQIATTSKPQIKHKTPLLVEYVSKGKLDSDIKLQHAIKYLLANPMDPSDIAAFEVSSGVGVFVTADQIEKEVSIIINQHKDELLKLRYKFNAGPLMGKVRDQLKFANGKLIKGEFDIQILQLLGPKSLDDLKPPTKIQKTGPATSRATKETENAAAAITQLISIDEIMLKLDFHKPGEYFKTDGYVITPKTMDLIKQHMEITKGQVRTRFPPEPNGILHVGHAKAININFGYAKAHNGICFLRYDDTNPEKEDEKFFQNIHDMVKFLGYKPDYITHSSDYFDQLYEYALQLIDKDLAYVCHQKSEELKGFNPPPSPWRNRPTHESKKLFIEMRQGLFDEGEATLRMKTTLEEGKQDPVAYRIKFVPHPRSGDKWCIYPTYDYTHCLCDSIENITHSLCTKEFQSRRSSYYWLCNALDIFCPVQWEYGRLNLNYAVVSKRKILKLIQNEVVGGWDDPRLFTLPALRRRGFPPEAINNFCARMGVTGAQTIVDPEMLEAVVRDTLNVTAPRFMAVLEPLKLIITNLPSRETEIKASLMPNDDNAGFYTTLLKTELFIEASDYKSVSDKGYKRLTTTQSVGLRYAGLVITFSKEIRNAEGNLEAVEVICQDVANAPKPKAFIHWVSDYNECEVRLYSKLFFHKNPEDSEQVPNGFLSDCNPDSLTVISNAKVVKAVSSCVAFKAVQFERLGYFCVDPDTTPARMVFNRTCNLKEDPKKE